MLCRRCGMDSSTTDVCEWCKQPMLSPGQSVGGQNGQPEQSPGENAAPPAQEASDSLQQLELKGEEPPEAAPPQTSEAPSQEDVLRPLGGGDQPAKPPARSTPGTPSHGLDDSATQTSVDLSQYMNDAESIFRPIERPAQSAATAPGQDLEAKARRASMARQQEAVSSVPDNVRLFRCLVTGMLVSITLSMIQFATIGKLPDRFYFISFGYRTTAATALYYGVLTGLLFGLGIGALLVRLKRGSFLGLVVGVAVGAGLGNIPYALIAGGITGIIAGRFATAGYRRKMSF